MKWLEIFMRTAIYIFYNHWDSTKTWEMTLMTFSQQALPLKQSAANNCGGLNFSRRHTESGIQPVSWSWPFQTMFVILWNMPKGVVVTAEGRVLHKLHGYFATDKRLV